MEKMDNDKEFEDCWASVLSLIEHFKLNNKRPMESLEICVGAMLEIADQLEMSKRQLLSLIKTLERSIENEWVREEKE